MKIRLRRNRPVAILTVLAVLYVVFTVACGVVIGSLTSPKLKPSVVALVSEAWPVPTRAAAESSMWLSGAEIDLPLQIESYRAEHASCCVFYGPYRRAPIDAGVIVAALEENHPFAYCGGVRHQVIRFLSGCNGGPVEFQRATVGAAPSRRWFVFSPLGVIRSNLSLVAKTIYLEEADPSTPLRTFRNGETEIVWLTGSRQIRKGSVVETARIDRFLLANDSRFAAIDVVWKKFPRDEAFLNRMAASLELCEWPESRAYSQRSGRSNSTIADLYNLYRGSRDPSVLQRLVDQVAASGTERERSYLALDVQFEAQRNKGLVDLANKVADW